MAGIVKQYLEIPQIVFKSLSFLWWMGINFIIMVQWIFAVKLIHQNASNLERMSKYIKDIYDIEFHRISHRDYLFNWNNINWFMAKPKSIKS